MRMDRKLLVKRLKVLVANGINEWTYLLYRTADRVEGLRWLYRAHRYVLRLFPLQPFELTSHVLYAKTHPGSAVTVLATNRGGASSRLAFGSERPDYALIETDLPDAYLFRHENVRLQGNSDFVWNMDERLVLNDFSYDMDERYVNVDGALFTQKRNLALLRYDGKRCDRNIPSGIQLSGKFSTNYYHQVFENMIKLLLLERASIPANVPLLVDEVVLRVRSFRQLFESLNQSGREVIALGAKEVVEVATLYGFSAVNHIPPHKLVFDDDGTRDIFFDLDLTFQMRERLLKKCSARVFPSRIFLSRKSTALRSYNEAEVIAWVEKAGFTVVCPEEYDLYDQMALFQGAEYIIGASGAAFTNLLFCSEGCRIICIQSKRLNIPAFSTVAYGLKCPMRYCLGKAHSSDLHSSFTVDVNDLETMLNEPILNETLLS